MVVVVFPGVVVDVEVLVVVVGVDVVDVVVVDELDGVPNTSSKKNKLFQIASSMRNVFISPLQMTRCLLTQVWLFTIPSVRNVMHLLPPFVAFIASLALEIPIIQG